MTRTTIAATLWMLTAAAPTFAQSSMTAAGTATLAAVTAEAGNAGPGAIVATAAPAAHVISADDAHALALKLHPEFAKATRRPAALMPLYVMQGALQVMDVRSTFAAFSYGAHEANPVMKPFARNQGTMLAVKAGIAAATIWASERAWKNGNRMGAIVTMVAANSMMAFVVAHNQSLTSQLSAR